MQQDLRVIVELWCHLGLSCSYLGFFYTVKLSCETFMVDFPHFPPNKTWKAYFSSCLSSISTSFAFAFVFHISQWLVCVCAHMCVSVCCLSTKLSLNCLHLI